MSAIFDELYGEAARLLEHNNSDDEIIIVKTAAGNVYHQLIHCIGAVRRVGFPKETASLEYDAKAFLSMLREKNDTRVQYIFSVVNGNVLQLLSDSLHSVEIPPFCIREGLLKLDPRNADTIILTDGVHYRRIDDTMP